MKLSALHESGWKSPTRVHKRGGHGSQLGASIDLYSDDNAIDGKSLNDGGKPKKKPAKK